MSRAVKFFKQAERALSLDEKRRVREEARRQANAIACCGSILIPLEGGRSAFGFMMRCGRQKGLSITDVQ